MSVPLQVSVGSGRTNLLELGSSLTASWLAWSAPAQSQTKDNLTKARPAWASASELSNATARVLAASARPYKTAGGVAL